LTQPAGFWKGQYAWVIEAKEERRITDYQYGSTSGSLSLEYALTAAASSSDSIEITSIWPPAQIHESIDAAIAQASKQYPSIIVDETMIVEENKMAYALSGLSSTPWQLLQVYLERNVSGITGNPTASGATSLTDSAQDFSTCDTDHFVSIYAGTGSGQLRETSTGDSDGVLTVATWTTTPDTTSYYKFWDASNQQQDWARITNIRTDAVEYPSNLYFSDLYSGDYGSRIRLVYLSNQNSLASDSDVTTVPLLYVTHKALAMMHDSVIGDNRVDRAVHANLAEYYSNLADKYLAESPRRRPPGTVWHGESQGSRGSARNDNIGDPLGWSRD